MILTRDTSKGDYQIRSYEQGAFLINETLYTKSVLVSTHQLVLWEPQSIEELKTPHLEAITTLKPDVAIIGTGGKLIFLDPEWLDIFYSKNIGVEVMTTLAACRTFNVLLSEGRNVVAGLLAH